MQIDRQIAVDTIRQCLLAAQQQQQLGHRRRVDIIKSRSTVSLLFLGATTRTSHSNDPALPVPRTDDTHVRMVY